MVCDCTPETKKQPLKWKQSESLIKKKLSAQQSVKKLILTVFFEMKTPISLDFFENGATIKRAPTETS